MALIQTYEFNLSNLRYDMFFNTVLHLYQTKNWLVKRLSTIFIRIIQPGVQGKCLHNSKTDVIMLGVVKHAAI